ncbi:MAG: TldD/PmbA family protein [Elusimicrobia bacterium]|nr:TldD/PmbA family protein [Elusimicrobiota bacterium]MBP9698643.1 TldD/PmbA family protein [Elusimicrobiota bacterium]
MRAIHPRGWDVELFWEEEQQWEQTWAEGRRKDRSFGVGSGLAVRVVKNGRWGFASGTDTSMAGVRSLFDRACAAGQSVNADPARVLPHPVRGLSATAGDLNKRAAVRSVEAGEKKSADEVWDLLKRLERRALDGDRRMKKALGLSFHEARGVRALVSSVGIAMAEPWKAVSFSGELLGANGTETETAWGSAEAIEWERLNPEKVVDDVRARLVTSFGAKPLASGTWTILVSPRVGVDLMELLSQAVLGDAVEKGRSFLARRLGRKAVSSKVTVIDDGRLPHGVATRVWDDEGVPQRRTPVVMEGRLLTFLHDTASARRARVVSTGNASRPGREGPPSPGTTNFYLQPGPWTDAALYQDTAKAFEVRDVIGMHTADPVSGDFSVGAAGLLWEKGQVRRAVRGVTLSGNLLDLLAGVDAVANEVVWQGAFGSPLFRVKGLSVGGH